MAKSDMLHVRIDEDIKIKANEVLESMGLSMSEAVRLFLHQVVQDQGMPFKLKVPNKKTKAAMKEVQDIVNSRRSKVKKSSELFEDLEKNS